jgi:hypothetical protein
MHPARPSKWKTDMRAPATHGLLPKVFQAFALKLLVFLIFGKCVCLSAFYSCLIPNWTTKPCYAMLVYNWCFRSSLLTLCFSCFCCMLCSIKNVVKAKLKKLERELYGISSASSGQMMKNYMHFLSCKVEYYHQSGGYQFFLDSHLLSPFLY